MNQLIICIVTAVVAISLLHACGPSEEELRQQQQTEEQARSDSLERIREAEMEQMRRDSIEQARQDSIARAEEEEVAEEPAHAIQYDRNGAFTVQVHSWRSEEKAEEHAELWKQRGYEHAYVVTYGDESVGDVWFRVRLGNVSNHRMARQLKEIVTGEFGVDSWIASTDN